MNENEVNQNAYEEEKIDIDLGNENSFFVASNGNYFGIAFDKLFGQPQLSIYNTFEMSSKRNFKNLCAMILETYNELFLDENGEIKEEKPETANLNIAAFCGIGHPEKFYDSLKNY